MCRDLWQRECLAAAIPPSALFKTRHSEWAHLTDLIRIHRIGHVLLVGQYEQSCASQTFLLKQTFQLLSTVSYPLPIRRIDHPDDSIR